MSAAPWLLAGRGNVAAAVRVEQRRHVAAGGKVGREDGANLRGSGGKCVEPLPAACFVSSW